MGSTFTKKEADHTIKRRDHRKTTISVSNVTEIYDFESKALGHGHFGTVRLATLKGTTSPLFAVKSIPKEKMKDDMKLLHRELELLRDLDHPNIVKFYEVYQDKCYFHLVMEYCSGGEVMEKFVKEKHLTEAETAKIMSKAFSAVKYLHERGIVHRDIKPENFLYASKDADAEIKLIDFGLSRFAEPHETLSSQVGTPYYVAPEIVKASYDYRCDYWSLGVMMYILLCGYPPFDARNTAELAKEILNTQPDFGSYPWTSISQSAKELVAGLLNKEPSKRITAEKALSHSWIKKADKPCKLDHKRAEHIIENLRHFSIKKQLKKEVLSVLITHIEDKEIKQLRENFKYFDKHNTGEISIADLKKVIKEQHLKIKSSELQEIMKSIHLDDAHTISFSEFLFVTMDSKIYLTKQMLMNVFHHFDVDNTGFITTKNLKEAMTRSAKHMSEEEIERMILETQYSKDGKISFEDFCLLMKVDEYRKEADELHQKMKSTSKNSSISKFRRNSQFFKAEDAK